MILIHWRVVAQHSCFELPNSLPREHCELDYQIMAAAAQRTRGNASLSVELFTDGSIIEWLDNYWHQNILPLKGKISESFHSLRSNTHQTLNGFVQRTAI